MGDFYLIEEKKMEDIIADAGKNMDQITAMRVECADMELALAALNNPVQLKKLNDLAYDFESMGEDDVTLIDVKQEPEETMSESGDAGVGEKEMDSSCTNDNRSDSCSEVVVNNELTKD